MPLSVVGKDMYGNIVDHLPADAVLRVSTGGLVSEL